MLLVLINQTASHCTHRPQRRPSLALITMALLVGAGISLAEPGSGSAPANRAAVVDRLEPVAVTAPYRETALDTALPAEKGARVGRRSVPANRAAAVDRLELVGITAPHREATLAAEQPATIAELPAEEGASVGRVSLPAKRATVVERMELVGITAPYREATLAAVLPARIAELPAEEGARVGRGDLVVCLDETVQLAKTEMAAAMAASTLEIELARANWQRDQRNLDRLTKLHGDNYASSKELSDANADAEISRLDFEVAKFRHAQAQRAYDRENKILREFRLRAPFSGYVTRHLKQVGETVDQLEGIVTLVQLDPLRVLVNCPLAMEQSVLLGDAVSVRLGDASGEQRVGTVVLVSRVADGASQTFRIKLTVDNADGAWVAGARVTVVFGTAELASGANVGRDEPDAVNAIDYRKRTVRLNTR